MNPSDLRIAKNFNRLFKADFTQNRAEALLDKLSLAERRRAFEAMETLSNLYVKSTGGTVRVLDGEDRLDDVRDLIREYVDLEIGQRRGFDISFQQPTHELAELPGQYDKTQGGALFLAVCDDLPIGCVAYRRVDETTCEMKRLYVRPTFRGRHVASIMLEAFINSVRNTGYASICLDTDASMSEAIALYESMGFKRCSAYYDNPLPGATFFSADVDHLVVRENIGEILPR